MMVLRLYWERNMPVRLLKISITASIGILVFIVGLNNILDYSTNFDFIKHILSMDLTPEGPLSSRAILSTSLHHLFYMFIIFIECAGAIFTLYGAYRLWSVRHSGSKSFNQSKTQALLGMGCLFTLYLLGFMAIGGEWFQMWRDGAYNAQEPVFRFIVCIGIAIVIVNQPDE
jgi:predicted small integral membrane protein